MKKIIGFLLLVVVVAGVSAFSAMKFAAACGHCSSDHTTCSPHDWLHQKLQLSAEQQKALQPVEERFHQQYQSANEQLIDANRQLAKLLSQSQSFSPEVAAAIEHVHHRMGELQKLSIQHLYDMRPLLTPEQNERLVKYAQQALENNP
jgi:Spy/CpxP family protein refolding chaperone